ncbi:integration host factor, actinobacterial type (plasmid) [Prescottella equi]|uniref:integration host factor, actinobacterial type n=1 Tax=Rhodococcus hoagii TaxID=43767 RepID=UPI002574F4E3|nr:integration host factor, actinobacterial type [Prescottella equi]WJJ14503.1 integration host factor, actinobacterial type [Prescottella equi]
MALPTLTPEQRAQALEKAAASRRARAALREELKTGKVTFAEVLGRAGTDETVGRAKVLYVLESLPKVGKVTALEILADIGIAETRRMGGLGTNQRRAARTPRLTPTAEGPASVCVSQALSRFGVH